MWGAIGDSLGALVQSAGKLCDLHSGSDPRPGCTPLAGPPDQKHAITRMRSVPRGPDVVSCGRHARDCPSAERRSNADRMRRGPRPHQERPCSNSSAPSLLRCPSSRRPSGPAESGRRPSAAKPIEHSGALVVNIREQAEWRDTGVVPGALLVTFRDPDSFLAAIAPNLAEGQPIALICRSGRRSAAAAEAIAARTDHPVIDLAGGVSRLVGDGYALSPCGSC